MKLNLCIVMPAKAGIQFFFRLSRKQNWIPAFAGMTLAMGLAGCEGIGDGSTLQSLEVRPGDGSTVATDSDYKLYECIRDQLVVIGTFTDGTTADFSFRAKWTSSNPVDPLDPLDTGVDVSNGEILNSFPLAGVFTTNPNITVRPGTLIPKGVPTAPVIITAEFLGLRSSLSLVVGTPLFQISPAPVTTLPPIQPTHLGVGTFQRFNVIVNRDGQQELAPVLNQLAPINPLLWRFTPGPNVAFDPADFDKYTLFDGPVTDPTANPIAHISVLSGAVTGVKADAALLPIEAQLSLCPGGMSAPANPIPSTTARVAPFATTNPLTLAREAGFPTNGDLATNTNLLLTATANLDTDGNLSTAEQVQNLTSQSRFDLEPKDLPADCEATLTCTANKDLSFLGNSNDLRTQTATTGGTAMGQACFPFCVATLASLTADDTNPEADVSVIMTASAITLPTSIAAVSYEFNCGAVTGTSTPPTLIHTSSTDLSATCTYPSDGNYSATVRITDSNNAKSLNAGAVQIRVGGTQSATMPTAALTAFPTSGAAPLSVSFSAAGSRDADADDAVAVYEFNFGDGAVVRQTSAVVSHVYFAPGPVPTVVAIDKSGRRSVPAELPIPAGQTTALTITGTVPETRFVRSNPLNFTSVPATLGAFVISPLNPGQKAFTYPGLQFEAIGTFDSVPPAMFSGGAGSAMQKITRFVSWTARPPANLEEFSDIAFVRNFNDDLLRIGQVGYLQDVLTNTNVSIIATPSTTLTATVPPLMNETTTLTVCPSGQANCP